MTLIAPGSTVAVIGAGTMGAGIAQVAAEAGHPVLLFDARAGAADSAIAGILGRLDRAVEKGRLTAADRAAIAARLVAAGSLAEAAPASLVIEAILEDLAAKRQLFAELEAIVAADCVLASNTSSLSITAIAAGLAKPERCVGMHFFNPAPLMALVEVASGLATRPDVADAVLAAATRWGKRPVALRTTPGFIVNRVARPFYGEAFRLLEEGAADIATIDALLRESGGFPMGPFELIDLIGNDVNFAVTTSIHLACHGDPRYSPSQTQAEMVAAGRLGRKTGRGYYDYAPGAAKPLPATAVASPPPARVTVLGGAETGDAWMALIAAAGIAVDRVTTPGSELMLRLDHVDVLPTDGRLATERAAESGRPVVLFDLARDYRAAKRLALACADQAGPDTVAPAVGLIQACGKAVSIVDDSPGLVVMRTVAMIANGAADLVQRRIAAAAAIDQAMRDGANYPAGPLAWAEAIGLPRVLAVIDNLARFYGEDRYRASPLLRRRVLAGAEFVQRQQLREAVMADNVKNTRATIIPTMRYRDAPAAIDWLCRAFGFERHLVVPGKDGTILHAQLSFGNGMIMLGSARDDAFGRLVRPPVGGVGTQSPYVIVADADRHYARAKAAGAEILVDIKDEDYGGRGYTCRDPEGHVWSFGTFDPWE